MKAEELILFGGLMLVAYVYAGYPLILWLLGKCHDRKTLMANHAPCVTVIIAVYNEDAVIADKLANTLTLDYPRGRLEVLVASDGSTDDTEEIAARFVPQGVKLLRLPRCGKMRALEYSVSQARGQILVFTDANTWIESHALRRLVAHFADTEIGGVCGCKRIGRTVKGTVVAQGEGMYWKYDQSLKKWESRTGSTVAADGALYAIRRELFQPSADPAQADDMSISARIPMQGKRLVFEAAAEVWEEPPVSMETEFWRKVRVTNHALRSLWELRAALNPMRMGFFAVELWSHKLLRYFVPFPLAVAWIANCFLAVRSPFYAVLLALQSAVLVLALAGGILRNRPLGQSPPLHVPFYFCMAHLAALVGAYSALRGKRIVAWKHDRSATGLNALRKTIR
jgi:cellulose synthase/poly-beta-1,6-N-acetylglucosamine synthase-like glycosyltransferase